MKKENLMELILQDVKNLELKSEKELNQYLLFRLVSAHEAIEQLNELCEKAIEMGIKVKEDVINEMREKIQETLPQFLKLNEQINDKDLKVVKHMAAEQTQRKDLFNDGMSRETVDNITAKMKELKGIDTKKHLTKNDWKDIKEWIEKNLYLRL